MARFLVHIAADDLARAVTFYRAMFGADPHFRSDDRAEWHLDDPGVDVLVSAKADGEPGVTAVGLQLRDSAAVAAMRERLSEAGHAPNDHPADGDAMTRVVDPHGVAWQHFGDPDHPATTTPGHGDAVSAFVRRRCEERHQGRDHGYSPRPEGRM